MTTDVSRTTPELRVGIVGGGFMAEVHARAAVAAGAQIVGVASRDQPSAVRAAQRIGRGIAFSSLNDMLASPIIDVVHICTPNVTHAALTQSVVRAGKHVVCEKPLAVAAGEAADLAASANGRRVVGAVPFVYRFHPMVREVRARIDAGRTGRLFSIRGEYLQDWLADETDDDWRVDAAEGGPSRAFADIGSHLADVVEFVTGDPIARLVARSKTVYRTRRVHSSIKTEDLVSVLFETVSGVPGTLNVSQVSLGKKNGLAVTIDGENESLSFQQETPDVLQIGTKSGVHLLPRGADMSAQASRYSQVPAGHPQGYQDAFNAFVRDVYEAIRTGTVPPGLPTFADGARAVAITTAVLNSCETGAWVSTHPSTSPVSASLT